MARAPLIRTPARVLVVGTSAVGKSVFARRLALTFGVPHVELDAFYWGPEWSPIPRAEFERRILEACTAPAWVVDGNYGSVRHVLWPLANTVVWLDYGLAVTLWRGLRRTIARSVTGEELWQGNRESFRKAFLSRHSILLWILTTHRRRRRELERLRVTGRYPHLTWIVFRRPGAAAAWLRKD